MLLLRFKGNAQQRLTAASKALDGRREAITFPKFGSVDEAHQWFAGLTQDISSRYGVEIGANILSDMRGAYRLEDVTLGTSFNNEGMGYAVLPRQRELNEGYVAYTHTHPISSGFSVEDLDLATQRLGGAFVSLPNGQSIGFSYGAYTNAGSIPGSQRDPRFQFSVGGPH